MFPALEYCLMKRIYHSRVLPHLLCSCIIGILCSILYSNALSGPFVFDDLPNIRNNHLIRITDLGADEFYGAAFAGPSSARPLVNISFALNYYFGGYDVKGYHLINIVIHLMLSLIHI